jgi:TetR/AcrR family transcriptional regulator, lmrAB and yxaGH operons repressor
MAQIAKHKRAIVDAAVKLFRQRGYAGTGLNDIVKESSAPKGSLYHYFPEGKAAIGAAAVTAAGHTVEATLKGLANERPSPSTAISRYCELLAGWMEQSQFRDGCPIATTLLEEAPANPGITEAGKQAFSAWAAVIADALVAAGATPARAGELGRFSVSVLEGALIQARVEQSKAPLLAAGRELSALFEASVK